MKRKLITTGILAGAILSYSSNILADTHKFSDVPKWAEQSVNYLVDKQVLIGYPDGTFGSNVTLDRASAATIITKALGIEIDPKAKPSFTDSQDHWGAPYIAAAEKAGIIKGEGNGIFNPTGKVTRAAMATMLVNAYKLQSTAHDNGQSKFEDLKGHWGEKYANILIDLKISNGTDNGWQPNRFITRAEAAQLTAKTDMFSKEIKDKLREKVNSKDMDINSKEGESISIENRSLTTETAVSTQNKKEQILLNQHKKHSGKVTAKTEKSLIISDGNTSLDAIVSSPEILKDIQIGDTVSIYAPIFIDGLVFGQPDTANYAIVQKENEENVLKKQYKMHTGNVINKSSDAIEISSEDSTVSAIVSPEILQDINIGDTVSIYGAYFMNNMATGELSAKAPIIEKLASKTVTPNTGMNKSKSISEVDKKEKALLNQHKKRSGKVTAKTEKSLIISDGNTSLDAIVSSPEILKDIQIGDTVTIYAPIFIDGLVFGQPDTANYAIVQKENEENVLKKQYKMHTGNVINRSSDAIEISSEDSTISAIVSPEILQDINIGDTVTIYGAYFMNNMATGELSAKAPIVEKVEK
ncbi:S-layer homology domain-containing protein [Bacillus cereus]|uniref:S-layer homology domain-containing protein n=4 Tax=Bacillus cereus TaxID=1396 RepID=A0ABD7R8J4_BACCE|nr:S-layer homology domain-containing protein [Bacillus cereus]MBT0793021.1 S-layer homology domain-containing protein [Bacillus cereus]MBX9158967.1 S-layer homology domain-containing protein [Bacillus cereus]MDA2547410.1 S-layer homology domain-containing protein [Bacillus cereus]MDA2552795.1 S-layer homology domain-containing protein [Bacillus cereus]MDA4081079.1 S-layer homology domain-containing protein [Bacillus cereus]